MALSFFQENLKKEWNQPLVQNFVKKRRLKKDLIMIFQLGLSSNGQSNLHEFLTQNNIPLEVQILLGLVKKNEKGQIYDFFRDRFIFPIADKKGSTIAFGGRTLKDHPAKYINSSDSPLYHKSQVLYGWHLALPAILKKKRAILVEGYMDLIRMHEQGFSETLALCGTALQNFSVQALKSSYLQECILLFDQDEAGRNASLKAGELVFLNQIKCKVVRLSNEKDPDAYLLSHPKESLEEELARALFFEDFFIQHQFEISQNQDALTQAENIKKLVLVFKNSTDKAQRDILFQKIAQKFQIERSSVLNFLASPSHPTEKPAPYFSGPQALPKPQDFPKPQASKKIYWPTEIRKIDHSFPKEKEILQVLFSLPAYFSFFKTHLLPAAFENQFLKELCTKIFSYPSEEELQAALENTDAPDFLNEKELLVFLLKPMGFTAYKRFQGNAEQEKEEIQHLIFRMLKKYHKKQFQAQEEKASSLQEREQALRIFHDAMQGAKKVFEG